MEQLLKDYQPPPSYNDKHKRVGEKMLAAMSQEKLNRSYESVLIDHVKGSSDETPYQV